MPGRVCDLLGELPQRKTIVRQVIHMPKPKLTEEMVEQAIKLKGDGLSNGDIICALGIAESTFYRWIGDPKNRLQRSLSEGLKKEEARFK